MKLELKHLAPYLPYGLKVQYEGIINSSELSAFDKAFNESLKKESRLLLDRPDERIDFKIGKMRRVEFWDRWANIWVGNKRPKRVFLNEIKPLLLPMSSLYTEMEDGRVPIVELAKMVTGIDWYKRGWEHSDIYEISTVSNDGTIYFSFSKDSFSLKFRAKTKLKCTTWVVSNQLDLFTYLFENHFDVYGLIDKGLALDKTKIK